MQPTVPVSGIFVEYLAYTVVGIGVVSSLLLMYFMNKWFRYGKTDAGQRMLSNIELEYNDLVHKGLLRMVVFLLPPTAVIVPLALIGWGSAMKTYLVCLVLYSILGIRFRNIFRKRLADNIRVVRSGSLMLTTVFCIMIWPYMLYRGDGIRGDVPPYEDVKFKFHNSKE